MSTQLSCKVEEEDLSCIPLTDDLDDNENCIGLQSINESSVVCLTTEKLECGNSASALHSELQNENKPYPRRNSTAQTTFRTPSTVTQTPRRRSSTFDDLLFEIYDRWHYGWRGCEGIDSDTYTDLTAESDAFVGRSSDSILLNGCDNKLRLSRIAIESKDVSELKQMVVELRSCISQLSSSLVRQLKRRDRRLAAVNSNCEVITAILQASSLKRSVDSKLRFSIEPLPGDDSFEKWKSGMKAVAGLPMGIPTIFRKKVWLALADNYLHSLSIDWEKTKRFTFNEKSNPDDNKLGLQIVKDLHRTGCTGFSGHHNDDQRAMLKRVLLAYARWNKQVGYCQGFNIIAAFILDVMDRREDSALKVMIYLIDHVLPDGYFGNNLRALSVDMAVFRDLLSSHLPKLSNHLNHMQAAAKDQSTGASYEPPLTNVFTMQWFLTLFATCLPKSTALRVWDAILLEGSEILLRTSVAIWGLLEERILLIDSADDFYSSMAELTQEMADGSVIPVDDLIKKIYSMATLPMPVLNELREKYTYNITPFSAPASLRQLRPMTRKHENDDVVDIVELKKKSGELPRQHLVGAGPGAYAAHPEVFNVNSAATSERATLDIDMLNQRYKRIKEKQQKAHVILAVANNKERGPPRLQHTTVSQRLSTSVAPIETSAVVNHLFISSDLCLKNRNRAIVKAPTIAASFYDAKTITDRRRSLSVSTVSSSNSVDQANNNNNNIISNDQGSSVNPTSGYYQPGLGHDVDQTEGCDKDLGNVRKRSLNNQVGDEVVNERTRVISKALRAFTPFPQHHTGEQRTRRSGLSSLATAEVISDNRLHRPNDQ